ncbi:hexosaminidase D-like [Sycon ciliatum]|uniref:hexosaminidase D-like n=1 Tax=Sycon ciliatum TaxID=27933 RepID=UPI0031F65D54|eukprot:scpid41998/ scgid29195/ Hexosaminidase D; Beta-N-acetylhexosaminidase; Beta-hexosaminidase D; Hexosaminidase domain-containing protein; N-acetyl-beta-galactosaminidase
MQHFTPLSMRFLARRLQRFLWVFPVLMFVFLAYRLLTTESTHPLRQSPKLGLHQDSAAQEASNNQKFPPPTAGAAAKDILLHRRDKMPLIVHLDLKGAPPKFAYLREFLPFLKRLGAGGLLVEYEDTFPYSGRLEVLRSPQFSYSKEEINELVQLAHSLDLSIIPLVQTYGHMEFVLKHPEFASLREEPKNDWSVCPLRDDTISVLKEMVDQVMALHPHTKYVHIGGDEVDNMGHCSACRQFISQHSRVDLYRFHLLNIMQYIASRWPHVRSLFWDDMIRGWDVEHLKTFAQYGDPMVWGYIDHVERLITPALLKKFASVFPRVWPASSFKGSGGKDIDWVPVQHHINNHYSWNRLIEHGLTSVDSIGGFVLTGWSRYMHHFALCELMPSAIPSLALCLAVASEHTQQLASDQHTQLSSALGFPQKIPIRNEPHFSDNADGLSFPGSGVYSIIFRQAFLLAEYSQVRQIFDGKERARASEVLSKKAVKLMEDAEAELGKIYPPSVVREWLSTKLSHVLRGLQVNTQ